MASSCEHSNEPSSFMYVVKLHEWVTISWGTELVNIPLLMTDETFIKIRHFNVQENQVHSSFKLGW
jgi:hypothetical protein